MKLAFAAALVVALGAFASLAPAPAAQESAAARQLDKLLQFLLSQRLSKPITECVADCLGILSAIRRYSFSDRLTTILTAAASAIPVFVLGFVLQYLFAVVPNKQGWPDWARLRTSGLGPDTWTFFFIPTGEQWRYLILPAVTLACVSTALAARMTRGSMLEVLRADYMRTAKAKGLSERSVVVKHGLRNAMLPVVTLIGIDFGTVIGAAVLTETTFSWPGLGSEIANAVTQRDLPVILGLTLVVVIAFALINLLVDISYAWFDPRVRLGKGGN